ncbi:MAG: hypothetical protein IIC69_03150 [Nanoarchaeota archaeon]|nr:hypothetical protein [Nanoarchaeota archaeon]
MLEELVDGFPEPISEEERASLATEYSTKTAQLQENEKQMRVILEKYNDMSIDDVIRDTITVGEGFSEGEQFNFHHLYGFFLELGMLDKAIVAVNQAESEFPDSPAKVLLKVTGAETGGYGYEHSQTIVSKIMELAPEERTKENLVEYMVDQLGDGMRGGMTHYKRSEIGDPAFGRIMTRWDFDYSPNINKVRGELSYQEPEFRPLSEANRELEKRLSEIQGIGAYSIDTPVSGDKQHLYALKVEVSGFDNTVTFSGGFLYKPKQKNGTANMPTIPNFLNATLANLQESGYDASLELEDGNRSSLYISVRDGDTEIARLNMGEYGGINRIAIRLQSDRPLVEKEALCGFMGAQLKIVESLFSAATKSHYSPSIGLVGAGNVK